MTPEELSALLDARLDAPAYHMAVEAASLDSEEEKIVDVPVIFDGTDPRLKQLSHSSRTLLHKCPRKFQLYRLKSMSSDIEDLEQGVTFAYGTAVGVGLQSVLENKTENEIFMDVFLAWDQADLLEENTRQKKSIWSALFATERFITLREQGYLSDYELVYWEGKPAVELSFRITAPGGYTYRGYVDAVLQHKVTEAILILEAKTTSGTPQSATYKNSGQALGYSVVLDKIFPDLSSYEVLYLVWSSKELGYTEFFFEKSLLMRALWLQELIIDCKHIDMYEEFQIYPMHGESCYDFFRECDYLGLCTLSTEHLVKPFMESMQKAIAEEEYMFELDFSELVESQIQKGIL